MVPPPGSGYSPLPRVFGCPTSSLQVKNTSTYIFSDFKIEKKKIFISTLVYLCFRKLFLKANQLWMPTSLWLPWELGPEWQRSFSRIVQAFQILEAVEPIVLSLRPKFLPRPCLFITEKTMENQKSQKYIQDHLIQIKKVSCGDEFGKPNRRNFPRFFHDFSQALLRPRCADLLKNHEQQPKILKKRRRKRYSVFWFTEFIIMIVKVTPFMYVAKAMMNPFRTILLKLFQN